MATSAECASKLITKRVHVQFAVYVFGTAVERNEIRINLRHLRLLRVASEFANRRAPRKPDNLLVVDDAPQKLQSCASHCLLDGKEIVTSRDDETFFEPETLFHCRFDVLEIFVGNGDCYDALVESPLKVFAYGRPFDAEPLCNFRLLHVFEIVHCRNFD